MNKRIFTLLTAGLLLGGPAFNAAYAATDLTAKTVISYSENKTALANGMSFYLGASESALLKVTDTSMIKLTEQKCRKKAKNMNYYNK